ncbi:MAG: anaerobic ribonucleoside-triphosphate reductase activating protein [Elusimicrobiaceae bacterium]|nr:anaerobic ribonucleoside-triphosphate reductase activating protein [Elusimicrobiaceae bacterium]
MKYAHIKKCDIANGTGVRTSLFVSGCRNHCKGCFQPETWSFDYGHSFTKDTEDYLLACTRPSYIEGLSLLGGEPFEEENQQGLVAFIRRFKQELPHKTIWTFTGYRLEDLLPRGRKHTVVTDEILSYIDILVDGPFIEAQKNLMLKFRGSANQRIIDLKQTIQTGTLVLSSLNNN